ERGGGLVIRPLGDHDDVVGPLGPPATDEPAASLVDLGTHFLDSIHGVLDVLDPLRRPLQQPDVGRHGMLLSERRHFPQGGAPPPCHAQSPRERGSPPLAASETRPYLHGSPPPQPEDDTEPQQSPRDQIAGHLLSQPEQPDLSPVHAPPPFPPPALSMT